MDISAITRNTEEIITEDELKALLSEKKNPTTYCGYEVSGAVHIGTMVAVSKQKDFQDAGLRVKVLLADLHTYMNRKGSEAWIDEMADYWKDCFIALGLTKAEFVRGTDFEYDKEYIRDVLKLGLLTTLARATRSMQEVARDIENAHVSQMIYPLMQIADIKHMDIDIAHGGMEQRKIHMLGREVLPEIGYRKPVCIHTPLLVSLQGPGCKMSSSKPETVISVDEKPESIAEKINKAYCPLEKEGNPVLQMNKFLIFPRTGKLEVSRPEKFGGNITYGSYQELETSYLEKKLHPMDLKKATAAALTEILEPVREAGLVMPKA